MMPGYTEFEDTQPDADEVIERLRAENAALTTALDEARAFAKELQQVMLEPIACDVRLPPATTLRAGVSFATLRAAIEQRKGRDDIEFAKTWPALLELIANLTIERDEARALQACGHPMSLKILSVESNYTFCELCEARHMQHDAETAEAAYRKERDEARAELERQRNQFIKALKDRPTAPHPSDKLGNLAKEMWRDAEKEVEELKDQLIAAHAQAFSECLAIVQSLPPLGDESTIEERGGWGGATRAIEDAIRARGRLPVGQRTE